MTELRSAVYVGRVQHSRHKPKPHRFTYRLFQLYLDLDEVETLFDGSWLWSHERWNIASFRRRYYLGDPKRPLKECVRERVAEALGSPPPNGPIRVLTHLAFLGHCFNPVSFYYLFEEDGETLHSVTAEITNTPWGERHAYVLPASTGTPRDEWLTWTFPKSFHVSPFFPMDHHYAWSFNTPGDQLRVAMENHAPVVQAPETVAGAAETAAGAMPADLAPDGELRGLERVFDVALTMERRAITPAELRRCLIRHPWMTGKVHGAIYWQALRLWMKRTPFFTNPTSV